ncbi:MAG: T9SS type A sorting domain-containing protein [Bacteroidales bacterium]
MKRLFTFAIAMVFIGIAAFGQTTKTVGGAGASYSTLQLAFGAINSGAIKGQIVLQITGNITESASAILYASGLGASSYASVLIYPTGVYSISTSGNFAAIDLNGADNVTFDGRINQTGASTDLNITNTSIGNAATAIRLIHSAENNTVKYCTVTACSPSSAMGIITFAASNTGNGNDNNIVEYCNLTNSGSARPYNAILSSGTGGSDNSGDIIRNNNIYNTFQTGTSSNAININSASIGFTISGNSIYETSPFAATANALSYNVIRVSTINEHTISGNYIGGSGPICSGTWTFTAPYTVYFCGIYAYAGTGTATTISNNTIAGINYSSTEDNPWDGIFLYSGNFEVTGNTIGAVTGNGSITSTTPIAVATTTLTANPGGISNTITVLNGGTGYLTPPTVTFTNPPTGGTAPTAAANLTGGIVTSITVNSAGSGYTSAPAVIFDGQSNNYSTSHGIINNSIGTVNITGNNIGSITTVGSNYYSHGFESVYVRGASGTTTLSNNLIGSLTTPNSIYVSSAAASSLIKQDVYGLYCNSASGANIITGNTIANLTNAYSGLISLSRTRGIAVIAGTNTIQGNTVRNITSSSKQSSGGSAASVIGIVQSGTTAGTSQTINRNTIDNLSNISSTAKVYVSGIYYSGPIAGTHTISGNFIHSLSISSSDNLSDIEGIQLAGGTFTCANNIVNLGVGITGGYIINGIWDESNSSLARSILFNTVYIGGTVSSGGSITAAFNNQFNTSSRDFRNNVFFNARSGGSGKHYAYYLKATGNTGLTSDYNDYWVTATNGVVAFVGADKTLVTLQTATGGDTHSLNTDPQFASAGGTSALNYYTTANLAGTSGTGITTDYSGITRSSTPKMGALERGDFTWVGGTSTHFATAGNWLENEVPSPGANIIFAASPSNNCVLDQNRTVGNITNAQSTYKLVTNGKQLTINKSLIFSNSAQIDATSASSVVVFAGTSLQNISTGAFLSNTVDGLTLNNSTGLTLNGDLTVNQTFTLTSGAFAIGTNTLTLNGIISKTSGSLTGGASSNLVFGGSGASTSLPAISLNNLTINRSNGITLGGDVNVAGTLALTSGILTVGANTLTISGTSPGSSGGSVDASNASANLIFANAAAISLPSTFFTNSVNNLTLSGTGGVTAGSDITVNGELDLAAANPSATKGLLEMAISYTNYPGTLITHYLNSHILFMGATATTLGIGDVTGTVKRTTISENTPYTFGNQYTTISLTPGTMPTALAVTITIGNTAPGPNVSDIIRDAIKRTYEIVPTGGSGSTVTANFHYLDSELSSSLTSHVNTEQKLTTMDYDIDINGHGYPSSDEHGRANYDYTNNYIGLSSVPISYFIQIPTTHEWRTIFALRDYGLDYCTWNGSVSSDWKTPANWTLSGGGGAVVPTYLSHVIIPDAGNTPNDPILPAGTTTINTISIENGGVLTMGNNTIKIQNVLSGGWEDQNPLGNDPGTSTVIFNRPNTTVSGNSRFYNVQINAVTDTIGDITNQAGSTMKIAGSITRSGLGTGKWHADLFGATIEYNGGDQTIIHPDGTPDYHHLTLSGSGTKTMPASALSLHGNLTLAGTASATALGAMQINGNLTIGAGTTFATGAFDHAIGGDIICDGTLTPTASKKITMDGSAEQAIGGLVSTIDLNDLTISNPAGVSLFNITTTGALDITTGALTVIAGKSLSASGNTSLGSANCLILKSDATGTASFIDNGTITGTGTAKVERYLTPYDEVPDLKFHFISSPVSLQAIESEFLDFSSSAITDFYKWNESANEWTNYRGPTFGVRNENFGDSFKFVQGKGYMVAYPNAVSKNFEGIPTTGNIIFSCTHQNNGWNLSGNPYPSSILWSTLTKSNIGESVYYYDNSIPGYKYYNTSSGGIGGATDTIAPMQGFMVYAPTTGSITFANSARTHRKLNVFYKNEPLTTNILDLKVEGNNKTDYARVCFYNLATENFDSEYDAFKLFSYSETASELYFITPNNTSLAINTLPETVLDGGTVPLSFKTGTSGNYTINAERINTFANTSITLEDKVTSNTQKLNENPKYNFFSTPDDVTDRFILHFKKATSIPDPKTDNRFDVSYINGVVKVETAITNSNGDIWITDMTGRTIASSQFVAGTSATFNLNAKPGVYVISLYTVKQIFSKKVVVY